MLFGADDAGAVDVVIDPADPNRLFASIWQRASASDHWYIGGPASGIYRSTNGGDTWTELTAGLPTEDMGKIGLAIAPTDPNVVYANVIGPNGLLMGIFRSTNGGDSWEKRSNSGVTDWYGTNGYNSGESGSVPAIPRRRTPSTSVSCVRRTAAAAWVPGKVRCTPTGTT